MNTLFQNALKQKAQKTPPIWFMRQAGRYHQHYQKLKEKYTFMQLCKQPELAAEVAMGPIQDFDFDVAILFSDLLFPLEALGLGLEYNPGPKLDRQLTNESLKTLTSIDGALEQLQFQKEAMKQTRERLPKDKSLIGFVGGPWTLFTYAVEGEHKGSLQTAKANLALYRNFCEILVPLLLKNIELQFEGGAEVVMIFDTAAGEVSTQVFNEYLLPHLNTLSAKFPGRLGYYSKGTTEGGVKKIFAERNWAGFGVDHRWDLPELLKARQAGKIECRGFLQGNFDQAMLFQSRSDFKKSLDTYLKPYLQMSEDERAGWVCGLGHGVLPKTPEENVRTFIHTVREAFS